MAQPQLAGPQQKDTTFTKIFVGGLPYHTTDESLRNYFAVFGDIEEAVVITDRQTGKSRGYGFVTMTNKEDASRACKDPNPIIDGRKANVNLAYIGAKPRIMQTGLGGAQYQIPMTMPGTVPRLQYPGLIGQQQAAALQGIQLAYAGYPQLINPQMFQIQQPQASAAASGGANAAAQMMDPSSGYAFIDPTYAALALQMQQYTQATAQTQQSPSQTNTAEQQRY